MLADRVQLVDGKPCPQGCRIETARLITLALRPAQHCRSTTGDHDEHEIILAHRLAFPYEPFRKFEVACRGERMARLAYVNRAANLRFGAQGNAANGTVTEDVGKGLGCGTRCFSESDNVDVPEVTQVEREVANMQHVAIDMYR